MDVFQSQIKDIRSTSRGLVNVAETYPILLQLRLLNGLVMLGTVQEIFLRVSLSLWTWKKVLELHAENQTPLIWHFICHGTAVRLTLVVISFSFPSDITQQNKNLLQPGYNWPLRDLHGRPWGLFCTTSYVMVLFRITSSQASHLFLKKISAILLVVRVTEWLIIHVNFCTIILPA